MLQRLQQDYDNLNQQLKDESQAAERRMEALKDVWEKDTQRQLAMKEQVLGGWMHTLLPLSLSLSLAINVSQATAYSNRTYPPIFALSPIMKPTLQPIPHHTHVISHPPP